MQHLDEGTIHAWLDGALDATQSREVEAHTAQCATCSAAVAEARGLIAASSRILTALDDVPAGVVPKKTAAPVKPMRRQWRAAPWVSGIAAAALLAALGVGQLRRDSQVALLKEEAVFAPVADSQTRGVLQPVVDTTTSRVLNVPARVVQGVAKSPSPPPAAGTRGDFAANEAPSDARARDAAQVSALGAAAVGGRAAAPAPAAPAPAAVAEMKLDRAAVKSAPPVLESTIATSAAAADASEKRSTEESEVARVAGCYQIASEIIRQEQRGVVSGASGAGAAGRAAAPQARAAESRAATPYVDAVPRGGLVRLDTLQQRFGLQVRSVYSDTTTIGMWNRLGGDTAQVRLLSGIALRLTSKNRVDCPER